MTAAKRTATGAVRLTLGKGDPLEADEVLVATGRTPQTTGTGLESVGLQDGWWR
ncbi:MAG: hypothetical protein M3Y77_18195 [Actinomycetota bacterium]|nr:hypothetical protein [Actinomycetota bacterium]